MMFHTSFAYLEITSCNIPPFLKEKNQSGLSNSSLVYRSVRKKIAAVQIDKAILTISISFHVKSFPRKSSSN